jgi:hypothetical protein
MLEQFQLQNELAYSDYNCTDDRSSVIIQAIEPNPIKTVR